MRLTCELIGEIVDPTLTVDRKCGDASLGEVEETFYKVDLVLRGCTIPLIISEFSAEQVIKGKVKITGSLFSDYVAKQIPRFYIYANKVEAAEPDAELTNEISFMCRVTKIKELTSDSYGRDVLFMYASTCSPLNTESVLFLVLKNQMARVNKNRQPNFNITGTGFIKPFRDVYEILVKQFEVI